MQEVFPPDEMKERLRFTQFMNEFFVYRSKTTKDFKHPFDVDLLYRIYTRVYPDHALSEADLELYFNINGALTELNNILLDLRPLELNDIPVTLWQAIEVLLLPDKVLQLTASTPTSRTLDPVVNNAIDFFRLFVKRRDRNTKTAISHLYNLYALYAADRNTGVLGRKRFVQVVNTYLGEVRKGYASGKSGCTYAICEIPAEELWPISLEMGLGVFGLSGSFFDNQGRTLNFDEDFYPDQHTQIHIQYRLKGREHLDEPTRTPEGKAEQETENTVTGRETESSKKITPQAKRRVTHVIDTRSDERSSEIEIQDRGVGNNGSKTIDEGDITKKFDASEFTDERIVDEFDEYYQEEPTLSEIFSALQVVYKIHPETFNHVTMDEYLAAMEVDYAAEDLWDDFIEYIKGE